MELIEELLNADEVKNNKSAVAGLEDLKVLFKSLEIYGVLDVVRPYFVVFYQKLFSLSFIFV